MNFMNKRSLLELRNCLRRRGFWVDIIEGEFVLDSWYSRSNFIELVRLLNQFPLSLEIGEKGIRINSDTFPSGLLEQIETASRKDVEYSNTGNLIPTSWKYNERNDLSILELDYGIAALVFALNKVGFQTSMSCDGHGRRAANIWFNHQEYMEEMGHLLLSASKENSFAYDWEMRKESVGFALTARKRLANEQWDVQKVQDDVLSLSNYLVKRHA